MKLENNQIKEIYKRNWNELVPKIENAFYRFEKYGDKQSPYLSGYDYEQALQFYELTHKTLKDAELYLAAKQLCKNMRGKKARLRNKIASFMSDHCYFLTLTFKNEVLDSTTSETRKTYVKEFLKSKSNNYIANIDYGLNTEREHYHCIIQAPKGTFLYKNDKSFPYGFMKAETIGNSEDDFQRLSKYITKLSNHALKDTNNSHSVIYSRNVKKTI